MSDMERLLLNQITIMKALKLCLRQRPPLNNAELATFAELEGLIVATQKHLDDRYSVAEPEVLIFQLPDRYQTHWAAKAPTGAIRPEEWSDSAASVVLSAGERTWIFKTVEDRDRFVSEVPGASIVEVLR